METQTVNLVQLASKFKDAFTGKKEVKVLVDDYAVEVHHYQATIVKVLPTGEVTIDNGSYETATTKRHLNSVLDILGKPGITQKKFNWQFTDGQAFHRHFKMTTY